MLSHNAGPHEHLQQQQSQLATSRLENTCLLTGFNGNGQWILSGCAEKQMWAGSVNKAVEEEI